MPINGNYYDWESMEIMLPGGTAVDISEIEYADERGIEERYGKGAVPRGYGRKNYKASGSLKLERQEAERLRTSLGGSFYGGERFIISVCYANNDQPLIKDVLRDCKITKADTSGKSGDDKVGEVKLDFTILSPIEWNGSPAY